MDPQQEPPARRRASNDHYEDEDDDEDLLSEALLAVASAEEYAAKILKLQQACLTPLKEDLADWLNKIMNMSTITTDNFMDKLDNGVIICRLAKIISLWCEQQLASTTTSGQANLPQHQSQAHTRTSSQYKLNSIATTTTSHHAPQSYSSELSISTLNVHSPMINNDTMANVESYEPFHNHCNKKSTVNAIVTPLRQPPPRSIVLTNGGVLRSSSQSTNCLTTSLTTSLNNEYLTSNRFLTNLIRMGQTKIWEDAKCRTFYARDNVSNFIRWSKEFGVNQSVLFESDDLVLHANTRQVVLCLLDVARIACVKHGFTEAPGLVRFEQEIDRELAAEKAAAVVHYAHNLDSGKQTQTNETSASRKLASLTRNSHSCSVADPTDDLIMRYCIHREEEAAKKKAAELEVTAKLKAESEVASVVALTSQVENELLNVSESVNERLQPSQAVNDDNHSTLIEADSLMATEARVGLEETVIKSPSSDLPTHKISLITSDNRIDSLDSGEGRTESASTSHSRKLINSNKGKQHTVSAIPTLTKRSNSSSSLTTSSMGTSELSSSRSSLLSGHESNSTTKRHISSDLDGKVMRIAKSYYGKGATKGVTRLSEGKYKIADRIIFVRLLKGHRVMVRIGGGWDTLENFLFRHKSDPSQVIDVDNLLPLETKMTFEKTPQSTPTHNKFSKLPYYRRSSSASSTNLSTSNLSVSDHSPTITNKTSKQNSSLIQVGTPVHNNLVEQSSNHQPTNKQTPYFLIHKGQNSKLTPQSVFYNHPDHHSQESRPKESTMTGQQPSQLKTPNSIRYNNRTLGSSRTPAISATNLYPATLTTRLASTGMKTMGGAKINSTNNLHNNGRNSKHEAFRKLGRSNDSLQATFYKSPYHRQHPQNGSNIENLGSRKRSTPVEGRLMV